MTLLRVSYSDVQSQVHLFGVKMFDGIEVEFFSCPELSGKFVAADL